MPRRRRSRLAPIALVAAPIALIAAAGDAPADPAERPSAACGPDEIALRAGTHAFCIDRYEAPNEAGASPLAFQTAPEGEAWCHARGKRLCDEDEWLRACRGPRGDHTYPYGDGRTPERGACTDDRPWTPPDWDALEGADGAAAIAEARRLYRADPSGARARCVTGEGIHDLTGNVAEWVRRTHRHGAHAYPHVMKGCFWTGCGPKGAPPCDFTNAAHPGTFRTYEAGFRCCRDL